MRYILGTVAIIALSAPWEHADAASFECAKATSLEEIAICSDPQLSNLDGLMGQLYGELRAFTLQPEQLIANQRQWLRSRREQCDPLRQQGGDAEHVRCLADETRARIAELGSFLASDGTSDDMDIYEEEDTGLANVEIDDVGTDAAEDNNEEASLSVVRGEPSKKMSPDDLAIAALGALKQCVAEGVAEIAVQTGLNELAASANRILRGCKTESDEYYDAVVLSGGKILADMGVSTVLANMQWQIQDQIVSYQAEALRK